jgi:hypothetical protein
MNTLSIINIQKGFSPAFGNKNEKTSIEEIVKQTPNKYITVEKLNRDLVGDLKKGDAEEILPPHLKILEKIFCDRLTKRDRIAMLFRSWSKDANGNTILAFRESQSAKEKKKTPGRIVEIDCTEIGAKLETFIKKFSHKNGLPKEIIDILRNFKLIR